MGATMIHQAALTVAVLFAETVPKNQAKIATEVLPYHAKILVLVRVLWSVTAAPTIVRIASVLFNSSAR
jgi:hypothetical protein